MEGEYKDQHLTDLFDILRGDGSGESSLSVCLSVWGNLLLFVVGSGVAGDRKSLNDLFHYYVMGGRK